MVDYDLFKPFKNSLFTRVCENLHIACFIKKYVKIDDKYVYLDDVDYFIDDEIRNCEDALEKTKTKVIMFETDRTRDYNNDKMFKTSSWEEIFNYITKGKQYKLVSENL